MAQDSANPTYKVIVAVGRGISLLNCLVPANFYNVNSMSFFMQLPD